MADTPDERPLLPEEEEVDVLFRAQMWVYDRVMAHWKEGLAVIGVVLAVTLVYGLWDSHVTNELQDGAAEIAVINRKMPQPDQLALMGLAPLDDLEDPAHVATLTEGAKRYEAAAESTASASAATAWLKAAGVWRRLGEDDKAKAAYEAAIDARDLGLFAYAGRNGLAVLALEADQPEEALRLYRELADANRDFIGEQALLHMVEIHQATGDAAKAKEIAEELAIRYPDSPRVAATSARIGLAPSAKPAEEG